MEEEYYEDIELNHSYRTRYFDVTEADIISFASEWNPEPYHIDPKEAAKSKIGKIFACGPHLIAICTRLTNERRPRPRTIAGLGWNDLQFASPVFGGDKLLVEIRVISKRITYQLLEWPLIVKRLM